MASIPDDVLQIQALLEEYGFTIDNCDPMVINQILTLINQTSKELYQKSDLVRESFGDSCVNNLHNQWLLQHGNIHAHVDHVAATQHEFALKMEAVNQVPIPPQPLTSNRSSLPLPPYTPTVPDYEALLSPYTANMEVEDAVDESAATNNTTATTGAATAKGKKGAKKGAKGKAAAKELAVDEGGMLNIFAMTDE